MPVLAVLLLVVFIAAAIILYLRSSRVVKEKVSGANDYAKLMLDSAPFCCQIWDADLNVIDCNEAAVKLYGFKSKQEYAERFVHDCSPEYQSDGQRSDEKAVQLVYQAFEHGYSVFDWMHKMPDEDTLIPAEVTLVRVKFENDYIVAGYTRDLREHNKMMRELEYKDNLLHVVNSSAFLLLNSNTEIFSDALHQSLKMIAEAINVNTVYIWKNHIIDEKLYCFQLFEWPKQSSKFSDGTPYLYSETVPGWEEVLSKGDCINGIVRNMPPESQAHLSGIMSILVVPIFVKDEFWGFVGFDDDHRERIFTETEVSILRSGSLLVANAFLRNEMLLNIFDTSRQLEAALAKANSASKAKSDFLSTMSHEMRTPMNAIIGMTAIGKRASSMEEKNHTLNKIGDASSHLLGVINDILDMAKIEANKLELNPIEYNFEKMLQKVVTVINFRLEEKQQTLLVYIDKNIPPYLVGDDQRLAQVITNLMSNAVKFTAKGGEIKLEAFLIGEQDETCELCISVTDSGIGLSPEQQKRLFQSFQQAESGTSREYGGTGLGLAISKRIVELMGGEIWVQSELGKGSKFIFTVKAQRGEKKTGSLLAPGVNWDNVNISTVDDDSETAAVHADGEFAGKRMLLAEDIEINREILMLLLENSGLIIDCAENGEKALEMITAAPGKYDIVFMDLQMPRMSGYEATRRIRALEDELYSSSKASISKRLPIIAMTANVFRSDIDECIKAGMDDHLGKPIDLEKVFECLHKYLK